MNFKIEFDLEELVKFLLRARKHGYAGGAEKVKTPQRPDFKEFPPYKEGDFEYIDSYAGHYYAPGQEVVRFKGRPVWNMAYNGGMLPKYHEDLEFSKRTYEFLKEVLLGALYSKPFRGAKQVLIGDFEYLNKSEGDITNFRGTERILFKNKEVFRQDYIGGLIIDK